MIEDFDQALAFLPQHRQSEKRSRDLSLDDLLDEHRLLFDLSPSAFDLIMMSYRYQVLAAQKLETFLRKPLKPRKAEDLFVLAFSALISRRKENESKIVYFASEFAKRRSWHHLGSTLNAFLRSTQREKEEILKEVEERPELLLSETLSKRWRAHPELSARIARKLMKRPSAGISAFGDELELESVSVDAFSKRRLQAMSPSSYAFVVEIAKSLDDRDSRILDACAAPGAKLILLHQLMKKKGKVSTLGTELKFKRLERLKENLKRWGLDSEVSVKLWDWSRSADHNEIRKLLDKPTLILADLPCSGLGTIATRPDINLFSNKISFENLFRTQREIIESLLQFKSNDCALAVSLCSVDPEEISHVTKTLGTEPIYSSENAEGGEELVGWLIKK